MSKKKTHTEFVKEMSIKHPNLEVISQYKGTNTKIEVKDELDIIYLVRPCIIMQSSRTTIRSAKNQTQAFKTRSNFVHNNRYNYDKCLYISFWCPILITKMTKISFWIS